MSGVRLGAAADVQSGSVRPSLRERFNPRRFFQGERATDGPVTLTHRRIFILPTRSGLGLALLLAIQFLIAINYGNSLAFALTFLLVSMAVLSALYAYRNLAGLSIRAGRAEPVFAGNPAVFEVYCDNPSHLARPGLHARLRGGQAGGHFEAGAQATASVKLAASTDRRGWQTMTTVTLETRFPLGLFRAWSPVNLHQRVLVYPAPSPDNVDRPPTPDSAGNAIRKAGGDDDFFGFHDYRPGDPLRRIHWRGVAKGQGLLVKQYAVGESPAVDLDWRHTPGSDIETRLSVLCRWVLEADRASIPYSLRLPGQSITAAAGHAHRNRCLEALALFAP